MKQRNIVRELKPKVEPKKDEEIKEKSFDEDEVFKTKKEDLTVLPINDEPTLKDTVREDKEIIVKEKKKRQVRREMCGCGKDYAINAQHFHNATKHHKSWVESQKEKPATQNVEMEKISVPVSQESETQFEENKPVVKQTVSVANFAFDYDKIIRGVSDRYIQYKEEKKKVKEQDDYKTRYEKLLEEQNKKQKQQEARSYLQHQNQVFGRQKKRNAGGWFN
jgi:hypothetical protein